MDCQKGEPEIDIILHGMKAAHSTLREGQRPLLEAYQERRHIQRNNGQTVRDRDKALSYFGRISEGLRAVRSLAPVKVLLGRKSRQA